MDLAFLCGFALLAGFVDAVAGGGGLIQVPALFAFFPSAPPAVLLGTNKLAAVTGTTIATIRYLWSIPIAWRVAGPAALLAGASAVGGAKAVMVLSPGVLRPILLTILVLMAIYTIARPTLGQSDGTSVKPPSWLLLPTAAVFGFYDGFFGPGAGSVLMFVLVRFFGFPFLQAAANTKVLNLSSNFCSLVLFMLTGNVLYAVALPMAAFNVAGGFLGAHFAVKHGNRFIRVVFLVVTSALIAKLLFDLLKS